VHGGGYVTSRRPFPVLIPAGAEAYVFVAKYRCDSGGAADATRLKLSLPHVSGALSVSTVSPFGVSDLSYCHRFAGTSATDPGNFLAISPIEADPRLLAAR
jgi:hypothetical protein